jgi:deaminated glutathione amidase
LVVVYGDEMTDIGLKIATCQFPVSGDVNANADYICRYIIAAADQQCDVVHFCETALTGYAGSCPEFGVPVFEVASFDGYDWDGLRAQTQRIMSLARQHGICVVLGSTHYINDDEKPTNCLYLISSEGKIVDRYDKRMLTHGDQLAYSSGSRLVTTTINDITCGFLICADVSNPNIYHAYRQRGVQVLLHSYYNARFNGPIPNDRYVVPQNRAKAKEYGMWVFANNSSTRHSCWPTHIAGSDNSILKMRRHTAGMLVKHLKTSDMSETRVISTGEQSSHPRALDGKALP